MTQSKIILFALGGVFLIGGILLFTGKNTQLSSDATGVAAGAGRPDTSALAKSVQPEKKGEMIALGVILMKGHTMLEAEGTTTALTKEFVFKSGIVVSMQGEVTKKDGTSFKLKEGESVWEDGSVMKAGEMKSDKMSAQDKMVQGDSMHSATNSAMEKDTIMMKPGSYEVYAPEKIASAATLGHVVLFFRAVWCPTCRNLDNDIRAHLGEIPHDLTIFDVNYDNSSDMKKKYGVTYQHTFVEVDANGTLIKKWSGSPTLAALVAEVI